MQSEMFNQTEVETQGLFTKQNGKMLKAVLGQPTGTTELMAKAGAMVAYQGGVNFDGQMKSWGKRFRSMFSGEGLDLMKVSGTGSVFLANQAQDIHVLTLNGDGLTVDGKNVLAFEMGLNWDILGVDSGGVGIAGAGAYNVELRGNGQAVVCCTGQPLVMQVTSQNYYFADADAVIAWSSDLQASMQAAVTSSSSVWRPRGNTGEGWQMQFSGEGIVIVQPSELLPPYSAFHAMGQQNVGQPQQGQGGLLGQLGQQFGFPGQGGQQRGGFGNFGR